MQVHLTSSTPAKTWKANIGGEVIIDVYDPFNLTFKRTEEGCLLKFFETPNAGWAVLENESGRHVFCVG